MKLAIVIPTHNESRTIARVLKGLLDLDLPDLVKEIIVVDDGSTDDTAEIARSTLQVRSGLQGGVVVTHLVNRGLGGALGTGIEAALRRGADLVVTFDADGQHAPADIPRVIAPILSGRADVAIGSRMLGRGELREMPWFRRTANRLANFFTWMLFGVHSTDSQSGLRAFSKKAASHIAITANNYEVSSEIFGEIARHRLRLAEVPIRSIYTDYSLSKGQGFLTGVKTLLRLLLHRAER